MYIAISFDEDLNSSDNIRVFLVASKMHFICPISRFCPSSFLVAIIIIMINIINATKTTEEIIIFFSYFYSSLNLEES